MSDLEKVVQTSKASQILNCAHDDRKVRAIFPSLLACLCLADLAFLASSLVLVPVTMGITNEILLTLYSIFDCFSHISLSGSVFFTVAITFERYKVGFCLDVPFWLQRSSSRSPKVTVCVCVCVCVCLSSS